jgi:hypothetical protein
MFEDKDFPLDVTWTHRQGFSVSGPELPSNTEELVQDLELRTILEAMSGGDSLLWGISSRALLLSLTDPIEITYRQDVLADCLAHPDLAREMLQIAIEAIVGEEHIYRPWGGQPSGVLRHSVEVLELFVGSLKRLRQLCDDNTATVTSTGLSALFAMVRTELDDEYFHTIDEHLRRLKFKGGALISANLGRGLRGVDYVLRWANATKRSWKERIGLGPHSSYAFEIHPRDEAGSRYLSALNDRGVNLAANALAQSTDHILSFFKLLCTELGFYVSCLNLYDQLSAKGEPTCVPIPLGSGALALSYDDMYDLALALRSGGRVVGNSTNGDGKSLMMITGANSGGKSTLLRSIGQAQLMLQAGMFVSAASFCANVAEGLFTHFIREEDETMTSGKLDEEIARMSVIADRITPRCIILFNESFAATNEREGSEIARQIINALVETGVKVVFVTHQFTLADIFYRQGLDAALFLRAERALDGRRTFKIIEGEPLPTSFGEDLYRRIGGFAKLTTASVPEAGPQPRAMGAGEVSTAS